MAKRVAEKQITQDNWEEEEKPVEPGHFQAASEESLQARVIKRAKRRVTGSAGGNASSSPFASFSGLSSTQSSTLPTFSFLTKTASSANGAKEAETKQNGGTSSSEFMNKVSAASTNKVEKQEVKSSSSRDPEYFRLLKILNESVLDWVKTHMDKTPYCDFTPVFKDYEKYVLDLEKRYPTEGAKSVDSKKDTSSTSETQKNSTAVNPASNTSSASSAVAQPTTSETSTTTSSVKTAFPLTFGNKSTTSGPIFGTGSLPTASPAGFTFGLKPTNTSTTTTTESEPNKPSLPTGFSFGITTTGQSSLTKPTFSFAAASASVKQNSDEQEKEGGAGDADEENYEPPKNSFTPVEEADSVYSKRCKLFFKKDGSFVEKGVGTLYLKPLDGKTQLLIRADTNLGNILLNISLHSALPMSRTGKNNVLIVCLPEPPKDKDDKDAKPIPFLIRVKTAEEADELLEKLNEYKC